MIKRYTSVSVTLISVLACLTSNQTAFSEEKNEEVPFGDYKPVGKEEVVKTDKPLAALINIAGAKSWTKVPEGSLIHVPKRFQSAVGQRKGKQVKWSEFYKKNRGMIQLHKVTIEQARGFEVFDEDTLKAFQTSGRIVVATFGNSIISVNKAAFEIEKKDQ